jgi:Tol biopolymer transport system component
LALVLAGCGSPSPAQLRWSDDDAVWSPNGRTIFFDSNRGATPVQGDASNGTYALYSLRSAGGKRRRLTHNGCDDHDPLPSPNGREIAFDRTCCDTCTTVLMLVSSSGKHESALASNPNFFAWSPDGRSIAFTRERDPTDPTSNYSLWDVRPGHRPRLLVTSRFAVDGFGWSRDGKHIAFGCGLGSVCVIDVRTGAVRRLHRSRTSNDRDVFSVAWSRDDKEIAFVDGSGGSYDPNYSAWVMTAGGADAHRLPRFGEGNVDDVQWLPGRPGVLLVNTDYASVYLVDADGRNKHDLPFEADTVAPSRKGTRVLFVRRVFYDDGTYDRSALSLANLKTGKTERLTQRG